MHYVQINQLSIILSCYLNCFFFCQIDSIRFRKICKLRKITSRAKTVEALLYGTFQVNLSTKYGVEHEEVAKEQLANILGVNIEPSGVFVDGEQFYLAKGK